MWLFVSGFITGMLFLAIVELFLTGIGRSDLEQELIMEKELNRILRELRTEPNSSKGAAQDGGMLRKQSVFLVL